MFELKKLNVKCEMEQVGVQYQIKNYETIKNEIVNWIADIPSNIVIENDDDFKAVKENRAELNHKIDDLKTTRISLNNTIMGVLNEQFKEIEILLSDKEKEFKAVVDDYNNKKSDPKSVITATSKTKTNLNKFLSEVKKIAETCNVELKIK